MLVILYSQPCALLFQFIHSITPKYTTQFNSYLRFVQKKNESSYYSHSNPFNFPLSRRATNYIPKGILLFSLTQKVYNYFQKALLYDIICEIMLQIYCILAITQYCTLYAFLFAFFLFAFYFCC